jgi:hypothetical protein
VKNLVFATIVITTLSVAYFFGVILPKKQNFELQEKCAKAAKEYFLTQNLVTVKNDSNNVSGYTCHYNRRLNKALIKITSRDIGFWDTTVTDSMWTTDYVFLMDINEGKALAAYVSHQFNKPQSSYARKFTGETYKNYSIDGRSEKDGLSEMEWNKRVDQYMTE